MTVFRLVLIICVTVHIVECQVALVMNKYEFLPACWEPYGTVLANFLRVSKFTSFIVRQTFVDQKLL